VPMSRPNISSDMGTSRSLMRRARPLRIAFSPDVKQLMILALGVSAWRAGGQAVIPVVLRHIDSTSPCTQ
jgi:hypothetical protein